MTKNAYFFIFVLYIDLFRQKYCYKNDALDLRNERFINKLKN